MEDLEEMEEDAGLGNGGLGRLAGTHTHTHTDTRTHMHTHTFKQVHSDVAIKVMIAH